MSFKSAELKRLFEQLRAAGVAISASRAARLFRRGELALLVQQVIENEAERRQVETNLTAINQEIAKKREELQRYKTALQQAKAQGELAARKYLDLQLQVEQLKASIPNVQELQDRAEHYKRMIASINWQITSAKASGDYLHQLLDLRTKMMNNLDQVEKQIEENQAQWEEVTAKEAQRDQWGYMSKIYGRLVEEYQQKIAEIESQLDRLEAQVTGLKEKKREQELAIEFPGDRFAA